MATTIVPCPLPGTFYRRASPDQPPFKSDGDAVAPGDTVGLVEVMKTFTPVTVDVAGTVGRFLVGDEDAVMAGQPLLEVET